MAQLEEESEALNRKIGQACQAGREPPDAELEADFPLDVLQVGRAEDAVVGYSVCGTELGEMTKSKEAANKPKHKKYQGDVIEKSQLREPMVVLPVPPLLPLILHKYTNAYTCCRTHSYTFCRSLTGYRLSVKTTVIVKTLSPAAATLAQQYIQRLQRQGSP
ncbi:hypothetical protein PROFUN_14617 [Planoprotostelium fungivorum]|uniref:Uncharacterized protein n=1 Tax=Planoprotostelium fungivorum TaxID=1890364 RepID=A0A2P6MZD5_9EUKA|nr:hypothetical protein PROFUN_14617 [Planoprotostelium fungivorum]